jgi:uncharacterized protein
MVLEGSVTNVTNFGAFVDIGVHQDGLVHISMLADRFVKDPYEVVQSGQLVKVKVLEVDLDRKRIALSMRLDASPQDHANQRSAPGAARKGRAGWSKPPASRGPRHDRGQQGAHRRQREPAEATTAPAAGTMADAFAKARVGAAQCLARATAQCCWACAFSSMGRRSRSRAAQAM